MQQVIKSRSLGKIYYCNIFYGNGTARLVKNNNWRDKGLGVHSRSCSTFNGHIRMVGVIKI